MVNKDFQYIFYIYLTVISNKKMKLSCHREIERQLVLFKNVDTGPRKSHTKLTLQMYTLSLYTSY